MYVLKRICSCGETTLTAKYEYNVIKDSFMELYTEYKERSKIKESNLDMDYFISTDDDKYVIVKYDEQYERVRYFSKSVGYVKDKYCERTVINECLDHIITFLAYHYKEDYWNIVQKLLTKELIEVTLSSVKEIPSQFRSPSIVCAYKLVIKDEEYFIYARLVSETKDTFDITTEIWSRINVK